MRLNILHLLMCLCHIKYKQEVINDVLQFCHTDEVFASLQGEHFRDRALDDMMDGVLEVKKEDILKMVSPIPHFY